MITSIAPDRSTATIDNTIIVDIVGGVHVMPANQRQWCFEAIDTCSFDWMRLAVAQGLVTHDAVQGPAGVTPGNVLIVCQVAPKENIPRFDQGEFGTGVWGNPRSPTIGVTIWDGLGTAPPPFGGRVFFKETVIHALGHIAADALAVQKDPWKMIELGTAMGLGFVETESFDTPATPPDLLLPPDSRPTQAQIKSVTAVQPADIYNAWLGVGKHVKQMHRDDFFIPSPDDPSTTDSFYWLYWGKTVGLDGVPGMYNPDHPEVVGGGVIYQQHYITVDEAPWNEDPREFLAEAFKDIYAGEGSFRFTNRTKLRADYTLVDKHFSVRLPLGTSGFTGSSTDDVNAALIPPGTFDGFQDEVELRTGLPTSRVTQHSTIGVRPWIPDWKVDGEPHESKFIYQVTAQLDISQQTETQTITSGGYKDGLTMTIKLDEPPPGETLEDWLAGVGLGTLGSQITLQILINITSAKVGDHLVASDATLAVNTDLWFGNSLDGATEINPPWPAGVAVIGRGGFTFPLNIIVEWHAESRRGPGRLATGVVYVKGLDNGVIPHDQPLVGTGVTIPDQHIPGELDTGGTGYPSLPLTVNGQ